MAEIICLYLRAGMTDKLGCKPSGLNLEPMVTLAVLPQFIDGSLKIVVSTPFGTLPHVKINWD